MNHRLVLALAGLGALLVPSSCGGGSGGGSSTQMVLEEASNGFGRLLPYKIHAADAQGFPTTAIVEIRSMADILDNVTINNPILPVVQWPTTAVLPDGTPGNHFIYARFRQRIDIDSVLDFSPTSPTGLKGTILVSALNPISGDVITLKGKGFIGGQTYGTTVGPDGLLQLETWVKLIGGKPVAVLDVDGDGIDDFLPGQQPGLGFPGTETAPPVFADASELLRKESFVFVPDADNDLSTHELFPAALQVRMEITTGVKAKNGKFNLDSAVASSSVGTDTVPPEVKLSGLQDPDIVPGGGEVDVDPETNIVVGFTEPVQLATVGSLPTGGVPALATSILLQFGPPTALVTVPFTVLPASHFDLTRVILDPLYAFPGAGPEFADCGAFNEVTVIVNSTQFSDLVGNVNTQAPLTTFETAAGPGLVNAPVMPDAIYVTRVTDGPSLSVIDLSGFGASTGDPTFDPSCVWKEGGNTNYPNNPNVLLQGSFLIPPLVAGGCPFNGGSSGPLSLTRDSSLDSRLVRKPIVQSAEDVMVGWPLDLSFNNGLPFGCQSGGGNLCAQTGLKIIPGLIAFPNLMAFAPHPNPPPLIFPPLCLSPNIGGQEPTSIDTPVFNLLNPGPFPLGIPESCTPPQGLLGDFPYVVFGGPSLPQPLIINCTPYSVRQQIGNFLYMADRQANEVVVLNSNRMTVLDRISVTDPTRLAMGPDMDFIAVTSQLADSVSFIDIDPSSSNFHQVVKTVNVGQGPTGVAWQPESEDIFVCNTEGGTVTIISGFNLEPRKTLLNQLTSPFEVVLLPRLLGFGLNRGVYFGFILNQNGTCSLFESGPDGVNGWGYDDVIGQPEFKFNNPTAIQADHSNFGGAVYISHQDQLDFDGQPTGLSGGALTLMHLEGFPGIIPLDPGFFVDPSIRDLEFEIDFSIGSDQLTGVPVDFAFDILANNTILVNLKTTFSPGVALPVNGKSLVRPLPPGFIIANLPKFIFCAVPTSTEGPGVIDVIQIAGAVRFDTDPFISGTQSIPAPGANGVMGYFRQ